MPANFNTMMMASSVLQGFMNSLEFFQFGFRFEQDLSGIYILKCAAFKVDKTIGNPSVTMTTPVANAVSLNFEFKSVLIVTKATLSANGFNGTRDMYLIPRQSVDNNVRLPYVSYLINDQASTQPLVVTSFLMKPSPPYVVQN